MAVNPEVPEVEDQVASNHEPMAKIETIRQIVAFLEVLQSQQTDRSVPLDPTLASVSRSVSRLGNKLETPLFEGLGKRAKITRAGKEFITDATKILAAYDDLFNPKTYGLRHVRVGTYTSIISQFFGRRVYPRLFNPKPESGAQPFPRRFPLYQVEVTHSGGRAKIIQGVEQQTLDFGIIDRDGSQERSERFNEKLEWIPLFESAPFGVLYSGENAANRTERPSISLESLRQRTLFLTENDLPALLASGLGDPFIGQAARICVSSYAEVFQAVAAGSGIGLGFEPQNAPSGVPVGFVALSALECKNGQERAVVKRLERRGRSKFGVCIRKGWSKPPKNGGLSEAAKFVLASIKAEKRTYLHDYTV